MKIRIRNRAAFIEAVKNKIRREGIDTLLLKSMAQELEKALKKHCPVATGNLQDSISVRVESSSLHIHIGDTGKVKGLSNAKNIHRTQNEHYKINPKTKRKYPSCSRRLGDGSNIQYKSNQQAKRDFMDKAFREVMGIEVDINRMEGSSLPFTVIEPNKLKKITVSQIYLEG